MDNQIGLDAMIIAAMGLPDMDPDKIRAIQLKRINEVFSYVRAHSAFYRDLYTSHASKIASFSDFESLPVLSASDVIGNGNRMLCVSPEQAVRAFTSGTTSAPKRILFTEQELLQTIEFFQYGSTKFISKGQTALLFFPCQAPYGPGDLFCSALEYLGAFPVRFGVPSSPEEAMTAVRAFRPHLILASPETSLSLLEVADPVPFPVLLVSGSALSEKDQSRLRSAFSCRIFLEYGLTETAFALGLTCADSSCYHLREDSFYTEILDEKNQPLPVGTQGRVVITSLCCGAMPLIRYDTGDRASFLTAPCHCSSRLPVLSLIEPRNVPKGYFSSGSCLL